MELPRQVVERTESTRDDDEPGVIVQKRREGSDHPMCPEVVGVNEGPDLGRRRQFTHTSRSRVRDGDVDAAVVGQDPIGERIDGVLVANVDDAKARRKPFAAQALDGLLTLRAIAGAQVDHGVGAELSAQASHESESQALVGTGHKSHLGLTGHDGHASCSTWASVISVVSRVQWFG
jgi:hypothetical protein